MAVEGGNYYSAQFTDIAVSAQQDLFNIVLAAITDNQACFELVGYVFSQRTVVDDETAETLKVDIVSYTAAGGGGSFPARIKINQVERDSLLGPGRNDTSFLTAIDTLHSEMWNITYPLVYMPPPDERLIMAKDASDTNKSIAIRLLTTPANPLTMSGTFYWHEFGRFT